MSSPSATDRNRGQTAVDWSSPRARTEREWSGEWVDGGGRTSVSPGDGHGTTGPGDVGEGRVDLDTVTGCHGCSPAGVLTAGRAFGRDCAVVTAAPSHRFLNIRGVRPAAWASQGEGGGFNIRIRHT